MDDIMTIISQVKELWIIIHEKIAEGYKICKGFQTFAIIKKINLYRKSIKSLDHRRKELSLGDLIIQISIEENK